MKLIPNIIIGIILCFIFLGSPCQAGITIGPIEGPFSLDCESARPQGEYGPCWSPDGAQIAFAWGNGYTADGTNPEGSYICIMTADGQPIRPPCNPTNPLVNDIGW